MSLFAHVGILSSHCKKVNMKKEKQPFIKCFIFVTLTVCTYLKKNKLFCVFLLKENFWCLGYESQNIV